MAQVTIRSVKDEWLANAKSEAARRGVSLNSILLEALRERFGSEKTTTNGLEQFAGCLPFESDEERQQWEDAMKLNDQVDEELWR